jgi:hypothetical protein
MEIFLTMLIKPFVVFVVFLLVFLIAKAIHWALPDGRLKRILFSHLPGHRDKPRRY